MPNHYTAPEMLLFTDTKFKQELNAQNINKKQLKNMLFQWRWMEGGYFFLSNQESATNGCEEGHSQNDFQLLIVWRLEFTDVFFRFCCIFLSQ